MPDPPDPPGSVSRTEADMATRVRIDATERRVLDAIDRDGLLRLLKELIAIRTDGGNEAPAQARVTQAMHRIGLAVDEWTFGVNVLRTHRAFSMEIERREGVGVVGGIRGGRGPMLLLNGHTDVVPAGDLSSWTVPPWRATSREGRIYGRGAVDMKGGLCCALFAAKAIHDANIALKGSLVIESVIGEEDGGVGTLAACLRGYRADGAIVLEPTELKVAPAQAGALSFRITVPGLSAHACVREEGVSAIEKFLPIHDALRRLERETNRRRKDPLFRRYRLPYALSIGTVHAGSWPSSVADRLVVEGRYGIPIDGSVATARKAFEATVRDAARADPWLRVHRPRVEWWGGQFEPARIPPDHPIARAVEDAFCDANGGHTTLEGMTYGSDMRHLVHVAKTPTVLFGPGDVRQAHRPDEFVLVDDLVAATRTLVLTAMRFCGRAA